MFVTQHAEDRITARLGAIAGRVLAQLEQHAGHPGSVAYEVARLARVRCDDGSNGDQVVVIVHDGSVETVMFRRSWNQPFTPAALRVARCEVL